MLWHLYQTSSGKQHLKSMENFGTLMGDLADRAFKINAENFVFEHTAAVQFFSYYADDVHAFRAYICGNAGIPSLIEAIKVAESGVSRTHTDILWYMCETLSQLSAFHWCVAVLAHLDACPVLVELLSANQRDIVLGTKQRDVDIPAKDSWVAYCIVRTLRNLSMLGEDKGKKAVCGAVTDELRQILPNIADNVNKELGDVAALSVENWIKETWP